MAQPTARLFTTPGVFQITLEAGRYDVAGWGGSGGGSFGSGQVIPGGVAANLNGTFILDGSYLLDLVVGGKGEAKGRSGGGGGGASFLLTNGGSPENARLLVAVAGGGGESFFASSPRADV